jgi:hypothetical protein
MSPEEKAQLRQLMRKSTQLPEPSWNLFARTTRRFSRAKPPVPQKEKPIVKKDDKATKGGKK